MQVSFHGAARTTTGSCHLLQVGKTKALIDNGLFQAGKDTTALNKQDLGFDPKDIDFVILSHAHLDHCGRLPYLVKHGFRGEIITTEPSYDLSELILQETAHIREENAKWAKRKDEEQGLHLGDDYYREQMLYDTTDVLYTLNCFGRRAKYNEPIELSKDVQVTFKDAGHILGSAFLEFDLREDDRDKKIIFSGDLGNSHKARALLNGPESPSKANYAVTETTYSDKNHLDLEDSIFELYSIISNTLDQGGNIYIPIFSIERAQEYLDYLREGIEHGFLPADLPVYLDSPMAIAATKIYRKHSNFLNTKTRELIRAGIDPFTLPNLKMTRTREESMAINDIRGGAVILSAAGMAEGGRIRHHIKHNIKRPECSFIFGNYAAKGTLSRQITDGAQTIHLFGKDVPVRAKIHHINGFSAHADQSGLLKWHRQTDKPDSTFFTHGELPAMNAMKELLKARGCHVEIPELHQEFNL